MPAKRQSPLLYRYLNWGDGESYSTFQIEADLDNGFFLLRHIGIKSGEALAGCRIVHLGQLMAAEENVVLYDDFESVENWGEDDEKPEVVRLVPRMPVSGDGAA